MSEANSLELLCDNEQRRGSAHESGHVVAGLALGLDLDHVCLLDSGQVGIRRGRTLWKNLNVQHCAVQCFVTAAGMAGEQRVLGGFSVSHAKGDLDVLMNAGRSLDEIDGDRKVAFRVLQYNAKAHGALARALIGSFNANPVNGGLIAAEEAIQIFRSNEGRHIDAQQILEAPELWLQSPEVTK